MTVSIEYVRTDCGHVVDIDDTRTDASEDRITLCAEWTECGKAREAADLANLSHTIREDWERYGKAWTLADEALCRED